MDSKQNPAFWDYFNQFQTSSSPQKPLTSNDMYAPDKQFHHKQSAAIENDSTPSRIFTNEQTVPPPYQRSLSNNAGSKPQQMSPHQMFASQVPLQLPVDSTDALTTSHFITSDVSHQMMNQQMGIPHTQRLSSYEMRTNTSVDMFSTLVHQNMNPVSVNQYSPLMNTHDMFGTDPQQQLQLQQQQLQQHQQQQQQQLMVQQQQILSSSNYSTYQHQPTLTLTQPTLTTTLKPPLIQQASFYMQPQLTMPSQATNQSILHNSQQHNHQQQQQQQQQHSLKHQHQQQQQQHSRQHQHKQQYQPQQQQPVQQFTSQQHKAPLLQQSSKVLLLTVDSHKTQLSVEQLYWLCAPFGYVTRIVVFLKHQFKALIEFETVENACLALTLLHTRHVYVTRDGIPLLCSSSKYTSRIPNALRLLMHPDCFPLSEHCVISAVFSTTQPPLKVIANNERARDLTSNPIAPLFHLPTSASLVAKVSVAVGKGYRDNTIIGMSRPEQTTLLCSSVQILVAELGLVDFPVFPIPASIFMNNLPAAEAIMPQSTSSPLKPWSIPMQAPHVDLVVWVSNIPHIIASPQRLAVLMGVYANIVRIRMTNREHGGCQALVLTASADHAQRVSHYLDGLVFYGHTLSVLSKSNADFSQVFTAGADLMDSDDDSMLFTSSDEFTKTVTVDLGNGSSLHRFTGAHSRNSKHICWPSTELHVSSLPRHLSVHDIADKLTSIQGHDTEAVVVRGRIPAPTPLPRTPILNVRLFGSDCRMVFVEYASVDDAVCALIKLHDSHVKSTYLMPPAQANGVPNVHRQRSHTSQTSDHSYFSEGSTEVTIGENHTVDESSRIKVTFSHF